jgi:radical SAM protein with 4Fe4S-binding SPASM domain
MTQQEHLLLQRVVVPARLALLYRTEHTVAYNPQLNTWERLDAETAEVLRWLRAGRSRLELPEHLTRRFNLPNGTAEEQLRKIVNWCVLRRLLYLDQQLEIPPSTVSAKLNTIYWICTQACNLRCTYCYQDAMVARPNELNTWQGKDLVDQAHEAGADTFIFTGGEPFSRLDLLEVAAYSHKRGLITNVITNGHYITPKNVATVASIFDTVTISVDHGKPEHHERNRGIGSWQRAVNAIDLLISSGVNVDVNSVLTRYGLNDLDELLRFARGRSISQHRIVPQFPMGRGGTSPDDALTPDELLSLDEQLHRVNCSLKVATESKIRTEGQYSTKLATRNHCGAGLSEVSVDPEGWVYPCKLLQYPQFRTENVRDKRIASIYSEHPVLHKVRGNTTAAMAPCKTCIIKNHCGGGCRGIHVSFTQEYISAHPLFCAFLRNAFELQAWSSTGEVPPGRSIQWKEFEQESTWTASSQFVPLDTLLR